MNHGVKPLPRDRMRQQSSSHNLLMHSMTPEQAIVIRDAVSLPLLHAERPVTQRVIAAIPPDKGDFRPDDVVMSAIDLAWHIVAAEARFISGVIEGGFDLTRTPRPDGVRTGDEVNRWYAERFPGLVARLGELPAEQLTAPLDFRGVLRFPAILYVQVGINHTIHHRGQLSMFLRPMGAKVPSIYGESYDARLARENAQR
jgi:uncharacterized damage-inducible protein DinB